MQRERERRLAEKLAGAAPDPLFLADVDEIEGDFAAADAEIGGRSRG